MKQDPPLCLEGSPFLENDGIKKEKEKRPPNMEREEMSVSSFIRQNNRRGQVSERSLPRTISLLLLLLVINPIIRDMRTTRQREINYTVRCTVWSSHESQRPKHLFIQKCCHYVGDNTQTPSGNGQEIFLFLFTSLQGYPVI